MFFFLLNNVKITLFFGQNTESSLSSGPLNTSPLFSACWLRSLFGSCHSLKQLQGWLLCDQGDVLPNSRRTRDPGYKLYPASQKALGLTLQAWRCFIIHSCRIPLTWTKSSVLQEGRNNCWWGCPASTSPSRRYLGERGQLASAERTDCFKILRSDRKQFMWRGECRAGQQQPDCQAGNPSQQI